MMLFSVRALHIDKEMAKILATKKLLKKEEIKAKMFFFLNRIYIFVDSYINIIRNMQFVFYFKLLV